MLAERLAIYSPVEPLIATLSFYISPQSLTAYRILAERRGFEPAFKHHSIRLRWGRVAESCHSPQHRQSHPSGGFCTGARLCAKLRSRLKINEDGMETNDLLWKVSYGDVVMYFEDKSCAQHNFDAFRRADLNPTMREYRLVSTISS